MLSVIVDACILAIDAGIGPESKWIEVGYTYGGRTGRRDRRLFLQDALPDPLRARVAGLIDLLERIDDRMAAQRDIGDLPH